MDLRANISVEDLNQGAGVQLTRFSVLPMDTVYRRQWFLPSGTRSATTGVICLSVGSSIRCRNLLQ